MVLDCQPARGDHVPAEHPALVIFFCLNVQEREKRAQRRDEIVRIRIVKHAWRDKEW